MHHDRVIRALRLAAQVISGEKALSPLQKEFREFFAKLLEKYGVSSPADLSDDQKKDLFNDVARLWEKGEGLTEKAEAELGEEANASTKVEAASGPQIYVAHLGAYVAGKLRGDWIEPATDTETLWEQIREAVGVAKPGEADEDFEWAIHDYDNFPDLGEHPSLDDIATVAQMLEDEDDPEIVAAAIAEASDVDDAAKLLNDGYSIYDSESAAGEQFVDDIGTKGLSNKESYIDMDMLARDLGYDTNIVYVHGTPYAFFK